MPPRFLEFAKIVLSARQNTPACIWQSWSIRVAEPICAHAALLPDISYSTTDRLVGLSGHAWGIMPGAVTLSVPVLDHATIPGSNKISLPGGRSRIRDLLHQRQWKISDRRGLGRDGFLLSLRELLDSFCQIQIERRHSNPSCLGVVCLAAQPLDQGLGECPIAPLFVLQRVLLTC